MSEPRTETGRALRDEWFPVGSDGLAAIDRDEFGKDIAAIEAEATAAAEQRLGSSATKVRALPSPDPSFPSGYYTADMVSRAAVLAILEGMDE